MYENKAWVAINANNDGSKTENTFQSSCFYLRPNSSTDIDVPSTSNVVYFDSFTFYR